MKLYQIWNIRMSEFAISYIAQANVISIAPALINVLNRALSLMS